MSTAAVLEMESNGLVSCRTLSRVGRRAASADLLPDRESKIHWEAAAFDFSSRCSSLFFSGAVDLSQKMPLRQFDQFVLTPFWCRDNTGSCPLSGSQLHEQLRWLFEEVAHFERGLFWFEMVAKTQGDACHLGTVLRLIFSSTFSLDIRARCFDFSNDNPKVWFFFLFHLLHLNLHYIFEQKDWFKKNKTNTPNIQIVKRLCQLERVLLIGFERRLTTCYCLVQFC